MKRDLTALFKSFGIEALVYSVLVLGYFFAVLHFLGGWLLELFQHQRKVYALVALLLIIGQGLVLEILTRALLRVIKPGGEK